MVFVYIYKYSRYCNESITLQNPCRSLILKIMKTSLVAHLNINELNFIHYEKLTNIKELILVRLVMFLLESKNVTSDFS